MKTKMILSTIVATLLLGGSLFANTAPKGEAAAQAKVEEFNSKEEFLSKQKTKQFSQAAKKDKTKQIRKNVNAELTHHTPKSITAPQEVIEGFASSILAIEALDVGKTQDAKEALKRASELFEQALKDDPKLGLIPISDDIQVSTYIGDAKSVKEDIKTAQKLLKNYDTQAAREILLPMKDEMSIVTKYLLMDLYPDAVKDAKIALENGDEELSITILLTALDTVVVDTVTIPISILSAQDFISVAAKLDKSKKDEALKLLSYAEDELKKAVLLGYISKNHQAFKSLKKEIKALKKEIKGKNSVEKLYEHLKSSFSTFVDKIRKEVTREK